MKPFYMISVFFIFITACYKDPLGPAGGYVFYDKGSYSDGWRYLEAAPEDTEWEAAWGAHESTIGGTSTEIGTGKTNTQIIVAWLNDHGESGKAAQLCDGLNYGGYNDWFLPSKDELDMMYQELQGNGVGGFADDVNYDYSNAYWSSSEADIDYAWVQTFHDGLQYHYYYKGSARYVRAVRAF